MSLQVSNNFGLPSKHEMAVFSTMAKTAVSSKMYQGIGGESGVMMIMLAAREFNIPPMQALNGGINIVEGKVELSARIMGGLIRRAGHKLHTVENTDEKCTLHGIRKDDPQSLAEVTYTIQDARKAGLIKARGAWERTPKDMVYARALSRMARQLFQDVIGVGYIQGEISECQELSQNTDDASEIIETPPQDLMDQFLDLFQDKEDKILAMQYLNTIMSHYGWTQAEALKKILQNPVGCVQTFHKWKEKNTKKNDKGE